MQTRQEKHTGQLKRSNALGPCAYIFTSANTGSWRLERPQVDYAACKKCGICQQFCPAGLITIDKNSAQCVQINFGYCKGCGICANQCPQKCITMAAERGE